MLYESFGKFPNHDSCRNGNVHRVFGAELWNLQTSITHVNHALVHPFYLIAENDSKFL